MTLLLVDLCLEGFRVAETIVFYYNIVFLLRGYVVDFMNPDVITNAYE